MRRWLDPDTKVLRVLVQVVLLVAAAALVYGVVMWLGADLASPPGD